MNQFSASYFRAGVNAYASPSLLLLPARSGMANKQIRASNSTLCQNDRAGMEVRPELCRSPVKNTPPQAITEIMIAQNAMLLATVAASMTTNEVFLIFSLPFKGEAQS